MKRILLFLAVASLVAPARAQLFDAPLTPTQPPFSLSLGAGLPTALANPANSNGGVTLLTGSATLGDCLVWGANGIQDMGSTCVTSPIGTANLTGTGAAAATSLANRATDFGVTFNLKTDFGAACNGSTDDTTAIQNWLMKAGPGVHLFAPAGTCNFSAPLTIGSVSSFAVSGAGETATVFNYVGPNTSATATAGASWVGGSLSGSTWTPGATTITLSASAPSFVASNLSFGVTVWDTTNFLAGTAPTPTYVGMVASVAGATITLTGGGAANASVGSSDSLKFSVDLLTVNGGAAPTAVHGVTLGDFRITSHTVLGGGYALRLRFGWHMLVDHVAAGGIDVGDAGDLAGGYWFDGTSGGMLLQPNAASNQGVGDAVLVNSVPWFNDPTTAGLTILGDDLGGDWMGGFTAGIHIAGGFGGATCDQTNIAMNSYGVLIDDAVAPAGNREFSQGATCNIDDNLKGGALLNDTMVGAHIGVAYFGGWIAGTNAGPGIQIEHWGNSVVDIAGDKLWWNCGSGLYVQDTTTHVKVSPQTDISWNGGSAQSGTAACTTWMAANPGHTYGIEASSLTSNIYSLAQPSNNPGGAFNVNAGLLLPSFVAYSGVGVAYTLTAPTLSAYVNINEAQGTNVAGIAFQGASTTDWQIRKDSSGNLDIWDSATSGSPWFMHITPGGAGTIGESGSTLAFQGNATVAGTFGVTGASTLGTVNEGNTTVAAATGSLTVNATTANNAAGLYFQDAGATKWQLLNGWGSSNAFELLDASTSYTAAIEVQPGGSSQVGETNSNILTVVGSLAAKNSATPTASGTCSVGTLTGGQIAGSFKASATCSSGTVILTFAATQADGYVCEAQDETTPADLLKQTAHSTTSVTFTATMASSDVVVWKCVGF